MDKPDLAVARWVADHRSDPVTHACRLLEDLAGSPPFFAAVLLVGLVAVGRHRAWSALPGVVVALLVTIVATAPLKDLVDRPRPPAELALTSIDGSAMPSSHAIYTSAAVVSVVMASWWTSQRARRAVALVGVAGCLVVAAAMVYLGGHWVSDVLVGWLLGAGISGAVMLGWQRARSGRRAAV